MHYLSCGDNSADVISSWKGETKCSRKTVDTVDMSSVKTQCPLWMKLTVDILSAVRMTPMYSWLLFRTPQPQLLSYFLKVRSSKSTKMKEYIKFLDHSLGFFVNSLTHNLSNVWRYLEMSDFDFLNGGWHYTLTFRKHWRNFHINLKQNSFIPEGLGVTAIKILCFSSIL